MNLMLYMRYMHWMDGVVGGGAAAAALTTVLYAIFSVHCVPDVYMMLARARMCVCIRS